MIEITTTCCNKKFVWGEPGSKSYGKDMPQYCPWCGARFTIENPVFVDRDKVFTCTRPLPHVCKVKKVIVIGWPKDIQYSQCKSEPPVGTKLQRTQPEQCHGGKLPVTK